MERQNSVEISNKIVQTENLKFVTVKSQNLKGRGDICVFEPQTNQTDLPIVILLHGVYGSSWAWAFSGNAHITAQNLISNNEISPMILAMPSDGLWGDGSAYVPHHGFDFEKWIVEDVVQTVISTTNTASKKSPLFIAGLSMGGFGALRLGAKYSNKFKAFAGHSSITNLIQMKLFVEEQISGIQQKNPIDEDVLKTMELNKESLSPFRFDCGLQDSLLEHNRELHNKLCSLDINHIYEEFEGDHNWIYWETYLKKTLLFFNSHL